MSIHKGEFNFKLKKTGFLSQPKMEARLIARHPQRFLENYADRKIGVLNSENDALDNFIDQVKEAGDYDRKQEILMRKESERKQRAFLLHMAASPAINSDLMKDFQLGKDDGQHITDQVDYELIIEKFLTDIKMADKEDIEEWIASYRNIRNIKLPYGLPENLRMPLDPSSIEDAAIVNFVESANDEFLLLDGEYHTKMEEICQKLSENYASLTENSKWTISESALLFYVVTALEESPTPASASLQYEMTARLFQPGKTREEIISQKYLLKSKRVLEEKRANVVRDWLRDKQELQAKTNAAWEALHRQRVKKLEHSIQLRKQKEICLEWAQLLRRMRQVKSENIRKIQIMAEPFVKKRHDLEKHQSLKEAERRRVVKSAAQKYKERKMEDQNLDQQKKQEIERIVENIRKAQLEAQRSRVDYRKGQFEQKMQTRKAIEMMAEEERQRKAVILESIKEKVEIQYDPCNVVADTHATMVRRHETMSSHRKRENSDDDDMVKFFREQYSFSAETLWRDRRVKLEAKLREAGLMGSTYAQAVLQAMQPKEKPHLSSQIKFDQDSW